MFPKIHRCSDCLQEKQRNLNVTRVKPRNGGEGEKSEWIALLAAAMGWVSCRGFVAHSHAMFRSYREVSVMDGDAMGAPESAAFLYVT